MSSQLQCAVPIVPLFLNVDVEFSERRAPTSYFRLGVQKEGVPGQGQPAEALEGPGTITSHRHANLPYVVQDSHCFTLNNELL